MSLKRLIVPFLIFLILIVLGATLSVKNTIANQVQRGNGRDTLALDSLATANGQSDSFVMPKYDEEAMMRRAQEQMLSQMTPEQYAEYQRQYQAYLKQQQEYERQKAEYERQMAGQPGNMSDAMKMRMKQLEQQFKAAQRSDSGTVSQKKDSLPN